MDELGYRHDNKGLISMSDLLLKMAQAATEDETLFASYIQQYASINSLSWTEVADRLKIGGDQLAKLALCSRPQPGLFNSGIMQVADYIGMERSLLKAFVAEVEGGEVTLTKQLPGKLKITPLIRKSHREWNVMAILPKQRSWAMAAVVLLMLLLGAFVFAQPKSTTAATLVVNQGQATVVQADARNGNQEVIVPADGVLTVGTGDHIFLTAASAAQILLIDGSSIDLAAGTEINVDELVMNDATYRVHLKVLAGRTLSRVVTVLGVGDRFEISTPSSTASVRGTVFTVAYISADETFISCDEGKVEVTLEGQESQTVAAGMEVAAVVGQPLVVKSQSAAPTAVPTAAPTAVPTPTAVKTPVPVATAAAGNETIIEEMSPKPEDIPSHGGSPIPNGPPEQVPGHTPDNVPGVGDPPQGEGDIPANDNGNGNNGNNGNGNNGNNGNGGPPEQVPGNTPDETPGNGTPPTGGGDPPGNANGNGNNSSGGNNNGGGNGNSGNGGKNK